MSTILLLGATVAGLTVSLIKDRAKTRDGLRIAKGMLLATGREIVSILALVSLVLAIIPESTIRGLLGAESPWASGIAGAVIGTVTIIPAFVAFPLSGALVNGGAHLLAVAAFITTLTMVGFATLPIEIKHFGRRFAIARNAISFCFALLIAVGVGVLL